MALYRSDVPLRRYDVRGEEEGGADEAGFWVKAEGGVDGKHEGLSIPHHAVPVLVVVEAVGRGDHERVARLRLPVVGARVGASDRALLPRADPGVGGEDIAGEDRVRLRVVHLDGVTVADLPVVRVGVRDLLGADGALGVDLGHFEEARLLAVEVLGELRLRGGAEGERR